jgi:hypothetical protein
VERRDDGKLSHETIEADLAQWEIVLASMMGKA